MTMKPSISLSDEEHAYAMALVEEGRFASLSGVLREALRRLREQEEADRAERTALRELLDRRARGPFVDAEVMDERVEAMVAAKRRERGLQD